ncbi:MAG TPA: 50S ribosomal protein L25 [Anaerolineales bacterium]
MAEEVVMKASLRQVKGKQVKALRRAGQLPAVIYGHGFEPIAITLDMHSTSRVLPTITSSHLVVVDVDGTRHTTLVRERQRHPVLGSLLHIDFLEVSLTEKLRTAVSIVQQGESPAVKNFNAVIVSQLERLEVEALPNDLPERFTVDLSVLQKVGDSIHVRDLPVPAGVQILTDPDEIVVLAMSQAAEEVAPVAEVVEGATGGEPEVIERGKKEEEEF